MLGVTVAVVGGGLLLGESLDRAVASRIGDGVPVGVLVRTETPGAKKLI
jgi:hypothetical protein